MRSLITVALSTILITGCEESRRVRELAGTYVTQHDEEGFHSRFALTLRTDHHWTSASEMVMNGKDLLAGGLVGDEIAPPSYSDSGTFALKGVLLSVNSAKQGVFQFVVSGDTLWIHSGRAAALATAVTGVNAQDDGTENFMVRQR